MATKLELLAPAKNYQQGVAAIDAGADALYIGGPSFGARNAASNSVEDIAMLTKYAHLFGVKVYVVINTIIYDDEIEQVEKLVHELYDAKVDALIVQDMAFAKMNIPPITLFASTQTTNLTPDRVRFLESVGFQRVILERALSLAQIKEICSSTKVDIECFVHGAICVSYSGNCYMSLAVADRSANRGVCAQPCRSTYNLMNERGDFTMRAKHLLSLKDLSLEHSIADLIESGVTSFKIEGRLKDMVYIKNSVAHYSNIINRYIETNRDFSRASYGRSEIKFTPNLNKSFSRSFTPYFIDGKQIDIASLDTAKSVGEYIGEVQSVDNSGFVFTQDPLHSLMAGDGICFTTEQGSFSGTYANRIEGRRVNPAKIDGISVKTKIYRNYDKYFIDLVSGNSVVRKIDASIKVEKDRVVLTTQTGVESVVCFDYQAAQNVDKALEGLKLNMAKSGNSIVNIVNVEVGCDVPFLPIGRQNELRRELFERAEKILLDSYVVKQGKPLKAVEIGVEKLDYKANVSNSYAKEFYKECGVKEIADAVELRLDFNEVELMRTSYCVRKELGICLKEGARKENLYIENNGRVFELKFDCGRCQMVVLANRL